MGSQVKTDDGLRPKRLGTYSFGLPAPSLKETKRPVQTLRPLRRPEDVQTPAPSDDVLRNVRTAAGANTRSFAFVITDLRFIPYYASENAGSILEADRDAHQPDTRAAMAARIRTILHAARFGDAPGVAEFVSGRRRYICRPFLLTDHEHPDSSPIVALMFERHADPMLPIAEISRRFHLSPRESETIRHLSGGLTTKEVAERMRVSPNTVKQFLRLIMSKMGVKTRTGILGKLTAG